MRYTFLLCTAFIVFLSSVPKVLAGSELIVRSEKPSAGVFPKGAGFVTIDPGVFTTYLSNPNSSIIMHLPVAGKLCKVVANNFSITDKNTSFVTHAYGEESSFVADNCLFLSGAIENESQSFVYLAVFKTYCAGYIERVEKGEKVRYTIAPLALGKQQSQMIIYRDSEIKTVNSRCFAEELPEYNDLVKKVIQESGDVMKEGDKDKEKGEKVLDSDLLTIQLALDLDDALYNAHQKDISRAVNYVMTVWGGVAAIYRRDANVTFRINYMRVWTTTDPYPSTNTGMLGQFREYWNANMRHVKRTLAHLMSGHGFGGVAWVGVLCNDITNGVGYAADGIGNGVTYPSPSYVWDLDVVSHETGHNFGSPHTHNCGWSPAIDSCYQAEGNCYQGTRPRRGTIMSYCHLTSFGTQLFFHPRVASLLRDRAEKAQCVYYDSGRMNDDVAIMDFVIPTAGSELAANAKFNPLVRIANNGLNNRQPFKVRFEIRNPQANSLIYVDSIQTPQLKPNESTTVSFRSTSLSDTGQWLFKAEIVSSNDTNTLNDSKTIPVYITPKPSAPSSIQVLDINASITVDAGSTYLLKWKATNCKTVRIFLTTDDGKTWENIISNYPADSSKFLWNVPFFPTKDAKIRIDNFENSSISDISDRTFTIRVSNDVQPIEFSYPVHNTSVKVGRFIPYVKIRNNGSITVKKVPVILKIKNSSSSLRFYRDTVLIDSIDANAVRTIQFDTVVLRRRGVLEMIVRTFYDKDTYTHNDSLTRVVTADTTVNAPLLLAPSNGAFINPDKTVLRWSSVKGATNYKVYVTNITQNGKRAFDVYETSDTMYVIDNKRKTNDTLRTFEWYVSAVDNNNYEEESERWLYYLLVWKYNSANKSFYSNSSGNTWLMALGQSIDAGVYMATIRNKQENDFLRKEFSGDLRVGLTDRIKEGEWKWVSGEPRTFQYWANNQPDNYQNNEHFLNLTPNGQWNDINENQINHQTIFEFPHYLYSASGNLPTPELMFPEKNVVILSEEQLFSWATVEKALGYYIQIAPDSNFSQPVATIRLSRNIYATDLGQLSSNGLYYWRVRAFSDSAISAWSPTSVFKFVKWKISSINGHGYEETPSMTWEQANIYALRFGAFLATVRSKEENRWIDSTFGVKNKWIGINDTEKEGEFVWVSGEKSAYTNWNSGEPNNYGSGEDYGHIGDNVEGKWNDISGNTSFTGVMERATLVSPAPIIVEPTTIFQVKSLPITLKWKKNEATSIYNIQIAQDPEFNTIVTDQSQANDTSFSIKNLPSGKQFYWRIRSRGNSSFGEWSDRRVLIVPENDKNLLAHWSFDNIETGTVYDMSSYKNNAVVANSFPKYSYGVKNVSLDFDGKYDALSGKFSDTTLISNDYTLCFFAKVEDDTLDGTFFDAYDESSKRGLLVMTSEKGTSLMIKNDRDSAITLLRGERNTWRHMAFVKKEGILKVLYDSYCYDSVTLSKQSLPISSNVMFGAQIVQNSITNNLSFSAEDIRLYNRALTTDEIKTIIGHDVTSTEENIEDNSLVVITPNPANTIVSIGNSRNISFHGTVFTLLGERIAEFTSNEHSYLWDCSETPNGLYLVSVQIGDNRVTVPIVISH